jgi:hypothetical protein
LCQPLSWTALFLRFAKNPVRQGRNANLLLKKIKFGKECVGVKASASERAIEAVDYLFIDTAPVGSGAFLEAFIDLLGDILYCHARHQAPPSSYPEMQNGTAMVAS